MLPQPVHRRWYWIEPDPDGLSIPVRYSDAANGLVQAANRATIELPVVDVVQEAGSKGLTGCW